MLEGTMRRKKDKDPLAQELGRRGGKARIKKLTREQISEACRRAALARWARRREAKGGAA
jgi:hypothetical protein